MMRSRSLLFTAAITTGLVVIAGPAFARADVSTVAAPLKAPYAQASHTSTLAGAVAWIYDGEVTGDLSLNVTQGNVTGAIVHANLSLPSGFTFNDADVYVVSTEADFVGVPTEIFPTFGGNEISAKGLNYTDTDGDGYVEFSLYALNADISTTRTTVGTYPVSSQYRTVPNRKVKEQTWVVSTLDKITLGAADTTDPVITGAGSAAYEVGTGFTSGGSFSADETVTWSLGNTDAALFSINGSGVMSAAGALSAGTYTVDVIATDTSGNDASLTVTITVTVPGP